MSNDNKETAQKPMGGGMGRGPGGGLSMPVQKAKDFKGTLKRLLGYLAPQKMRFIAVGILAIVSTIFSIFGPKVLGKATTKLAEGVVAQYTYYYKIQAAIQQNAPASTIENLRNTPIPLFDLDYIGKILLLMILLYVISFITGYIMSYIMSNVSQNTVYVMRNEVKEKLDGLPWKYFDGRPTGEILGRVTTDRTPLRLLCSRA